MPIWLPATTTKRGRSLEVWGAVRPANNATVTISKGSSLKFVWRGNAAHNVVKRRGPGASFNSGVKTHGKTWTHKFTRGGTYKLVCTIHNGMKLTVKVR